MSTRLLIQADLQTLSNLLRRSDARKQLGGYLVSLACVAAGGLAAGGRLAVSESVLAALDSAPQIVAPPLLGACLLLPLLFAVGMGLADARQSLFGTQASELLLCAPIDRGAIVMRAWLRCVVTQMLLLLALGWPALWGLARSSSLGAGPALAYPVLGLWLLAPAVAAQLLLTTLLRR